MGNTTKQKATVNLGEETITSNMLAQDPQWPNGFPFWDIAYQDRTGAQSECGDGTTKWVAPGYNGGAYFKNSYSVLYLGDNGVLDSQCPGIVDIRITRQHSIDKKKTPGKDGATLTVLGIEPAQFDIDIILWTPDQVYCFNRWLTMDRNVQIQKRGPKTTTTSTVTAGTTGATGANGQTLAIPTGEYILSVSQTTKTVTTTTNTTSSLLPMAGKNPPIPWACFHPILQLHGITKLIIIGMTGPHKHSVSRAKTITLKCIEWTEKATVNNTSTGGKEVITGANTNPAPPGQQAQQSSGPVNAGQSQPTLPQGMLQ